MPDPLPRRREVPDPAKPGRLYLIPTRERTKDMTEDQGYRAIGPDGTITLFKDLLRRLGEAGHDLHVGDPESRDNGEVTCTAVLFTAKHRYTLTAIQPPNEKPSRLWCFVRDRTAATNPHPQPIFGPERNVLGDVEDELTAETFRRIVEAIVANELVVLATAGERALGRRRDGDFAGEAPMAMVHTQRDEDTKEVILRMERLGVPQGLVREVVASLR